MVSQLREAPRQKMLLSYGNFSIRGVSPPPFLESYGLCEEIFFGCFLG